MLLNRAAFDLGIPRLFVGCWFSAPGSIPAPQSYRARIGAINNLGAGAEMMKSFDGSGEETVHTGPYGALPILIFPHDPAKAVLDGYPVDVEKAANQMQDDLKKALHTQESSAETLEFNQLSWKEHLIPP